MSAHADEDDDGRRQWLQGIAVGDFVLFTAPRPGRRAVSDDGDDYEEDDDEEESSDGEEEGEDDEEQDESLNDEDSNTDEVAEDHRSESGEQSNSQDDDDDSEDDAPLNSSAGLYAVKRVIKAEDDTVVDAEIVKLQYVLQPTNATTNGFHIYGTRIMLSETRTDNTKDNKNDLLRLHSLQTTHSGDGTGIFRDPTGDQVRNVLFHGRCPTNCDSGWLHTVATLNDLMQDYTSPAVIDHEIVCPVCVGVDLTMEQQALRGELELTSMVDMGTTISFTADLNVRLRSLGYAFLQYDECTWGYHFEDMPSSDDDDDGQGGDGYQNWAAAQDPNNEIHIRHRPVSDEKIAALPRLSLQDLQAIMMIDTELCMICRDVFKPEDVVVQLPCKHIFCDTGCIEHWLKKFDSCPTCRSSVSVGQQNTDGIANGDANTDQVIRGEDDEPKVDAPVMNEPLGNIPNGSYKNENTGGPGEHIEEAEALIDEVDDPMDIDG